MKRLAMLLLQTVALFAGGAVTGTIQLPKGMKASNDPIAICIEDVKVPIPESLLEREYVIVTKDKQFSPRLLVVPKGGAVRFPNNDPITHNVFSVSAENRFDAGRYGKGQGYKQVFENPGLVRVYCNVHHRMSTLIYVTENPYFTYADSKGLFRLEGLPPGRYTLTAIHYLAGKTSQQIEVKANGDTSVNLFFNAPTAKEPTHLNKDGKPYARSRSKQY